LVLLVVPALIAAQHDVSRHITAMRRGVSARASGVAWGLRTLWVAILAWGGATLGYAIWSKQLPEQITNAFPMAGNMSPMTGALGLFIMGSAALVLTTYIILALGFQIGALRRRRAA
jgi:hypothetical protein